MLKGLVGSKSLSREDMEPVLEKMKDHLIGKTEFLWPEANFGLHRVMPHQDTLLIPPAESEKLAMLLVGTWK